MSGFLCSMVGVGPAAAAGRTALTITAFGGATLSTAQKKFGTASLDFGDGVGDYYKVTAPSLSYFGGTGDMTFEFQYYRKSSGSGGHITDFRQGGSDAAWTIVDFEDGSTTRLGLYQNGYIVASNIAVPTTTWTHIALVRQGATVKWYKNGTLTDTSTVTSSAWVNRTDCFIGANWADQSAGNNANAYIDEIRISSIARYTANFTAPAAAFTNDANTLLLIHADGTNGSTTITDDVGVRSPKGISAVGSAQVDTAQSKFGGASALFDGTGDRLDIGASSDLAFGTGAFTIECFVRYASVSGNQTIIDFRDGSGNVNILLGNDAGSVFLYVDGAYRIGRSGTQFTTNTWYHVALSRSGTSTRLFIDGTQVHSTYTDTNSYVGTAPDIGEINSSFGLTGYGTNGHIDEFRISKTARYTTTFTPTTSAFVNDADTLLLIHANGTDGSTTFTDDTA